MNLTKSETARRLGVHPRTVDRMLDRKELTPVIVTVDTVMVDEQEVMQHKFINSI